MSTPVSDVQTSLMLFRRYQNNQNMIGQRVSYGIVGMWARLVDPDHFSDSWRRLEPVVSGIIDTHYQMSAADAADYYGLSRAVAGFYGHVVPGSALADGYLAGFTKTMGIGQFYHFLDGGHGAATASRMAMNALRGASVRVVLNGGRETVTKAVAGDDVALGWERIVEPRSCSYCSGLAASGGTHKAASEAFHAHDRCGCLARVIFQGQGSANEDLAAEWAHATAGRSGEAAMTAWSQYWSEKNGNSNSGQ